MKPDGAVAVRVDANPEIGLGHLRRCLTLMRQLRTDGFNVRLVGRHQFGESIEPLAKEFPNSWLEDSEIVTKQPLILETEVGDAEATLSIIGRNPSESSWVIVDHYGLNGPWERIIREAGHRVLAIDDYRDRTHCADILVSQGSSPFEPNLIGCAGRSHELAGPQFALVDPEFAFTEAIPSAANNRKGLLVSYGGSDLTGETSKALEAVRILRNNDECRERLGRVDVVVGQANLRTDEVIRLAKGIEDVAVHVAPPSLAPLMREVDVFLTAGGNSMIEGLTMRKLCLVTLTADNQAPTVAELVEQGAILSLGSHESVGPMDVAEAVSRSLSEYDQLVDIVRTRPVFDHLGAGRISVAIQSVTKDAIESS